MALVVKNLPANAGDIRDVGLILGSGRSPEEGMATHSSILAWRIPRTEEPGGFTVYRVAESDMTEATLARRSTKITLPYVLVWSTSLCVLTHY